MNYCISILSEAIKFVEPFVELGFEFIVMKFGGLYLNHKGRREFHPYFLLLKKNGRLNPVNVLLNESINIGFPALKN